VRARDAALRRLSRLNRLLVAGSVTLTGALAELVARTLPGKTIDSSHVASQRGRTHRSSRRATGAPSLRPPEQAPRRAERSSPAAPSEAPASTAQSGHGEEAPAPGESAQAQEAPAGQESAPAQEPAQQHEPAAAPEQAPAQEQAASPQPAPAQEAPVVSGGS